MTDPFDSLVNIGYMPYQIRGEKVLLDRDLAALFLLSTKRVNEKVARNIGKFPAGSVFKVSADEFKIIRSQSLKNSRPDPVLKPRYTDSKRNATLSFENECVTADRYFDYNTHLPNAFTKQGFKIFDRLMKNIRNRDRFDQ